MPQDPTVTAYIQRSAPFAQPILNHIRSVVHAACPEAEEKMKWSFPHFDYKGKMMCSMAAFKQHAVFGFWNAKSMKDPQKVMERTGSNTAMGHFGRITSVKDLPPKSVLTAYIKEAMRLNESGGAVPSPMKRTKKTLAPPLKTPSWFLSALRKKPTALAAFKAFPPGQQREYVTWLTEAKTDETKQKRLKQAVEWIAEGKYRNWKYMKR